MTAHIQTKIQCPMTCCLSFSLLPVSMNQKTHVSLTQFPVPALPGAYHSLPSCLFLLRLVWVSSCGLRFRPESLVSDSPGLCLAPAPFVTLTPRGQQSDSRPVCQSPWEPHRHGGRGRALTPRPLRAGSDPAESTPDLSFVSDFSAALTHC